MSEKNENKEAPISGSSCTRLGKVGGQAVLEGVMMKAGSHTVTTCRKEDGSIVVADDTFTSVRKKHKILNLPLIRGVVNFIEMMILSVKTLSRSAEALDIEEEGGKAEEWLKKHFNVKLVDVLMVISTILGVLLAVGLFMVAPTYAAEGISWIVWKLGGGGLGIWRAAVEGAIKVLMFILYLWGVSYIPDIKRTFMYHGAEHKTIACFEAEEELTPENAMKHKRFHPRCGTSFMFFMILLGIIIGLFVRYIFEVAIGITLHTLIYTGIRLLILPLVVGIGYEFIMYAGKHNNIFVRALSAPGLWVQRITTKEPTLDMLEIAIISTKCALRDDFPEFMEYYNSREWEKSGESDNSDSEGDNFDGDEAVINNEVDSNEQAFLASEDNFEADMTANAAEESAEDTQKDDDEN